MAASEQNEAAVAILQPGIAPGEKFRPEAERWLIHTENLMAAMLAFTGGPWPQPDPPHSHPHEQISTVLEGVVAFFCPDHAPVRLTVGDLFAVPPNVPHAIQLLSPTAKLVDCFTPLRQDFLRQP
jgi:quercetin dioxygenase-like cupin family protein